MPIKDFYTSTAAWTDTPAGDEKEDLVLALENPLKGDSIRALDFLPNTYSADFLWDHDHGSKIPTDLAESLREAYRPLFYKLIEWGVPESIATGLLDSLRMVPETLQCLVDNVGFAGIFGVHFVMDFNDDTVLKAKDAVEVELHVTMSHDDDPTDSMQNVVTLFAGDIYLQVK